MAAQKNNHVYPTFNFHTFAKKLHASEKFWRFLLPLSAQFSFLHSRRPLEHHSLEFPLTCSNRRISSRPAEFGLRRKSLSGFLVFLLSFVTTHHGWKYKMVSGSACGRFSLDQSGKFHGFLVWFTTGKKDELENFYCIILLLSHFVHVASNEWNFPLKLKEPGCMQFHEFWVAESWNQKLKLGISLTGQSVELVGWSEKAKQSNIRESEAEHVKER